ncbi:hypothetical protein BTVI_106861 [Pitangus sulphuratus]|nr:hypothetical protein BTVI_106861 [Pitangus sulphuratus]
MDQALLGDAKQWGKRQQAETDGQKVPPECEEELLYCAVTEHWNRLPREVVESLSPEEGKLGSSEYAPNLSAGPHATSSAQAALRRVELFFPFYIVTFKEHQENDDSMKLTERKIANMWLQLQAEVYETPEK